MDMGLLVTLVGIIVAGLAGVLGVWMERNPDAPPKWGWIFSFFIVVAACVEISHALVAQVEDDETDAALARVLERLSDIAAAGNNPALDQFVGAELALQARSNPDVVKKMEKSIAAKGGDPSSVKRRAAEGRRMAAGLPKAAPAPGEAKTMKATPAAKPVAQPVAEPASIAEAAAEADSPKAAVNAAAGAAKEQATAAATAKVEETKAAATAAATAKVDDTKAAATATADKAKADAAAKAEAEKKAAADKAAAEKKKKEEEAKKAAGDLTKGKIPGKK